MSFKSDIQPSLENDLVLLRPLMEADFENLYQVAKDPLIWEQHQNKDRWELEVFKDFFKDAIDSKGAFVVIDQATQKIIGSSRYKISKNTPRAIEIGWTFISREYWGGKYNKSFKKLMIAHAFEHFDYILFYVNRHNHRSQKAVQKLGGRLLESADELGHLCHEDKNAITFCLQRSKHAQSEMGK